MLGKIEVRGLIHSYGDRKIYFPDFELEPATKCLLSGVSGSGKTTLLHLLAGFLKVQSGYIGVGEYRLHSLRQTGLDAYRNRHVGYIPQKHYFWPSGTVIDQLRIAQRFRGGHSISPIEWLSELGIESVAHSSPSDLSIGQQQRLSIARALCTAPGLVLADEPTSSLDTPNACSVMALFERLHERYGFTLVVSTHDTRISDRFDVVLTLK